MPDAIFPSPNMTTAAAARHARKVLSEGLAMARQAAAQHPGHLSPEDVELLAYLATIASRWFPGDLLEIGVYAGKSASVLGVVAEREDRRVLCVDPWERYARSPDLAQAREHFMACVATSRHVVLDDASARILPTLKGPLCFAFIDGCHDYAAVVRDLPDLERLGTGVILFHDCDPIAWPGVTRAVDEFAAASNGYVPLLTTEIRRAFIRQEAL